MKEKLTQEENNGGIRRDKIFEVLNKKRKPDNNLFEYGQNQKKIRFIIKRVIPESNLKKIPQNQNNENIINYNNNLYTINQSKNFNNKPPNNNIIKQNIIKLLIPTPTKPKTQFKNMAITYVTMIIQ